MGRKAKTVFLLIITILFISFLPIQVEAYQPDDSFYMHDISGHWAEEDLTELAYMGILKGDNNQNANPNDFISRAEFIALLVRSLDYEIQNVEGKNYFSDIKKKIGIMKLLLLLENKG